MRITFPPILHALTLAACAVALTLLGLMLPEDCHNWGYVGSIFFTALSATIGAVGCHALLVLGRAS